MNGHGETLARPSQERTRVLFAIHAMDGGGAERQVLEILRHLNRSQFEPLLYLQTADGELMSQIPEDVPVHSFWQRQPNYNRNRSGPVSWAQSNDLAKVLVEQKVDVVYHRCYLMNLLAARSCRIAKVPQVASTVADPEAELLMHTKVGRHLSWIYARYSYAKANVVLANSEGLRQRNLEYFRLPEKKVQTIYNLFDVHRIDHLANQTPPDWDSDRYHVVSVGRLDHRKGQHILIRALKLLGDQGRIPELQLHLYGKGEDENKLRQMVTDLGLEHQVQFHGFDINPLPKVKRADLYCLSSLNEGMPNALVEAVICRTPTISSDCPSGPSEILQKGLYEVNNPAALAEAIWQQYQQRPSDTWLEEQRQYVIHKFSYQTGMAQLEPLLKRVAVK